MEAAGVLFLSPQNDTLFGWTPKLNKFSGIGGMIEADETPQQAAIREMLEELYGIVPTKPMIDEYIILFDSCPFLQHGTYGFYVIESDDYGLISKKLRKYYDSVPYYNRFPETIFNLIVDRNKELPDMEVTELIFMNPTYSLHYAKIDKEFIMDWALACKTHPALQDYESDDSSE